MSYRSDRFNVEDVAFRVPDGLGKYGTRFGRDGFPVAVGVVLDEANRDAKLWQRMVEQIVCSAVQAGGRYDFVARTGDVQNGERLRCLSRRRGESADAPFKRGNALFQHVGGRVHQPGVDVAGLFKAEQPRCMVCVFEDVRGGLVNRNRPGTSSRVGNLTGVYGKGVKT